MNALSVVTDTHTPEYLPFAYNSLMGFIALIAFISAMWWLFNTKRLFGCAVFGFCVAIVSGFVFLGAAMLTQNQTDRYLITAAGAAAAAVYFYRRFYILE